MDYLTLAGFRARTGLTTTQASDAALTIVLDGVEQLIKHELNYAPQSADYTEYLDGNGTEFLSIASALPVTAVTSVHENRAGYYQSANFTSEELLTVGTDYAIRNVGNGQPGVLWRINALWPFRRAVVIPGRIATTIEPCLGCVKVTYTAGLSATQMNAIINAGYLEAAAQVASWKNGVGVLMGEGLDGYNYNTQQTNGSSGGTAAHPFASPFAANILRGYKRIPISR